MFSAASFAISFAIAACAGSVNGVRNAGTAGVLLAIALWYGGQLLVAHVLIDVIPITALPMVQGATSLALMAVATYIALHAGFLIYVRKEGVSRPAAAGGGAWTLWLWLIIPLVLLILFGLVMTG